MTAINKALCLANLMRMGYSTTESRLIVSAWIDYLNAYSLNTVINHGVSTHPVFESGMNIEVGGKLFMSCHYGSYVDIVCSIGRRAKENTVHVLIGDEPERLKRSLIERVREAGITVYFIDGGFGMLRQLRKVLSDGFPVFVEIDVPWGPSQSCDISFPFVGGKLMGKRALFNMAERLHVEKNFVLSSVGKNSITICNFGDLDQSDCYRIFADTVRNGPHLYERLFQLHNYFEPEVDSDVAIIWAGKSDHYILHARDMKTWMTPHSLSLEASPQDLVAHLIGRTVSDVISI